MELSKTRRAFLGAVAAATVVSGTAAAPALAETFPSRPVTLIVPFPPGGATDSLFRALAQAASKDLGQPIQVVNRPGASGTMSPAMMAKTDNADGYTLAVLPASLYRLPHLQASNWDPTRDFSYVIGLTAYTYGVSVRADARWKTLGEVFSEARARPGVISYGTTGTGTSGHIAAERMAKAANVRLNFVPFKGAAEWSASLLGGHIDLAVDPGWGALAQAGKIRVLATATPERVLPSVPTLRELGHDVVAVSMLGIGGPAGIDPAIVKTLHDAFLKASKDEAFQRILRNENMVTIHLDSAAFTRYAIDKYESDRLAVKELGMLLK
ncbi:MAG: tripartite tricarboxylate transporter substrate binding protein [Gammaproteobacteria bacterium]